MFNPSLVERTYCEKKKGRFNTTTHCLIQQMRIYCLIYSSHCVMSISNKIQLIQYFPLRKGSHSKWPDTNQDTNLDTPQESERSN